MLIKEICTHVTVPLRSADKKQAVMMSPAFQYAT